MLNGLEGNPLGVRPAWTGNSGGAYITTTVNMPAAAAGQNVVLRWRMGTGLTHRRHRAGPSTPSSFPASPASSRRPSISMETGRARSPFTGRGPVSG